MGQRIIDLSLPLYDGMRGVKLEPATTTATTGYNTTTMHLYSHAGTHMDAPLHFLDGGGTIDQVPLSKCIGPALVVDLSYKEPNSLITVADLGAFAGRIEAGSRLLLRTDWDRYADRPEFRTDMPRISAELAQWLAERPIALLGVQTPSVASLRPENKAELVEVHQILLKAEIVIVEGLANLSELRREVVTLIALPLKVTGCDGSPARPVAIEDA